MKTYLTPVKDIERKWLIVDAQDKVLGRLASEIATRLRGKHKANYCTFQDVGDFVIVVNADKVRLTGRKWDDKVYRHHTGFMGGLKEKTAKVLMAEKPEEMLRKAVRGMLPKNTLGRKIVERQPVVRIFGVERSLEAEVVVMDAFSAHADKNDLVEYVSKTGGRMKKIFIVHGDLDQSEALALNLKIRGFRPYIPKKMEKVELNG